MQLKALQISIGVTKVHSMNPFGGNPPSQIVDSLLGKSYHVVKTVYLNLPMLKELNESESINFFFKHWDTVQNIESNIDAIKGIGANLEELLKAPEYIEEVKQEGQNQINKIWEAKEEAVKDFNIDIEDTVNQIKDYATSAAFSYRYCSVEIASLQTSELTNISPRTLVKVGDHVVTPLGNIYRITALTQTTFTVGSFITSIRGEKGLTGDPGSGLTLLGVYETLEQFIQASPTGGKGYAYLVKDINPDSDEESDKNHVYIWDVNTSEWKDAGQFQGAKGDPGQSANDILMDPDPEKYFVEIYGRSSGDIIGDLITNEPIIVSAPVETFNQSLEE